MHTEDETEDETPPEGIPAPPSTDPALPAARIRCFECLGTRMVLTVVERFPDGTIAKALASQCAQCGGTGEVTRAQWARYHAGHHGR